MAKSSLGKSVSRVGASGGGKTYAKARPAAYYAALTFIVIAGLSSVVYSRYERQHPVVASTSFPAKGTVGYFALATEACGTARNFLEPSIDPASAFTIQKSNVIKVQPTTAGQADANATLGAFVRATPGMYFSATKMTFPVLQGVATKASTYKAGTVCPAGTKYAGQKAYPVFAYWATLTQIKPTLTTHPENVGIKQNMLVTMAFVPKGVEPLSPSNAQIAAMTAASPTATTTLPFTTSTTLVPPTSTPTTAPATTSTTVPKKKK